MGRFEAFPEQCRVLGNTYAPVGNSTNVICKLAMFGSVFFQQLGRRSRAIACLFVSTACAGILAGKPGMPHLKS